LSPHRGLYWLLVCAVLPATVQGRQASVDEVEDDTPIFSETMVVTAPPAKAAKTPLPDVNKNGVPLRTILAMVAGVVVFVAVIGTVLIRSRRQPV
jgi:hypothetical protein